MLLRMGSKSRFKPKPVKRDPPWTPFEKGVLTPEQSELVARVHPGIPLLEIWVNSRYEVWVFEWPTEKTAIGFAMTELSIKRRDKGPIRNWRDMQRLKNEIVGPEREACELYPSEKRLYDTANQYHLWVLPEGQMFPFGYWGRFVSEECGDSGAKQQPFDPEVRPSDLMTLDEEQARLLDEFKAVRNKT